MRKHVLITGGAGFIGRTLAARMRSEFEVRVFDSYSRGQASTVHKLDDVHYVTGDILDNESLKSAMDGCDIVVHAAGVAGIDTVGKSPVTTLRVNALGTDSVLRAAVESDVSDRVICFSTSEVFGEFAFNVSEKDSTRVGPAGEPRWTYAASKLLAEHLAFAYWFEYKLPTVVVRPFNVYGPGQIGEGAIRKFVVRALAGEDLHIYGQGNQIRAWCFIEDFVQGLMCTVQNAAAVGDSFNIGNARAVATTLDLAQRVIDLTGSLSRIVHLSPLVTDIQVRVPDTTKAQELLGFEAQVGLQEGLLRTIKDFRNES